MAIMNKITTKHFYHKFQTVMNIHTRMHEKPDRILYTITRKYVNLFR
jgi:hypothetical protein